ncbi:MAG: hypothetical protein H6Q07_3224 [Acidobacteria bacterium]|nr:hypothetical protein [Acidobacteriota bacterium]
MTDRPRALAVLIAVFLLGGILGASGSYLWFRNQPVPQRGVRDFRPGPGGPGGRLRFNDMLQLSPEQEVRFREIMGEMRGKLDALTAEQSPKIEAIRTETNRSLMSVLNAEQKKKFADFLKQMEVGRRREPHGGRGMPPPTD